MLKENISLTQLFVIIVNFLLGSAIVIGVGKDAQQNSWIAIILGTLIGIILIYFYFCIVQFLPNKNLYEILEYCFTRPITILLSIIYVTYFIYMATRVFRTFAEMINVAVLTETPREFIILTGMLLLAYTLHNGLEVIARIAEIFSPYIILFIFSLMILLLLSGAVEMHNVLPILGDGLKPVLKVVFPSMLVFPFGEMIILTVILSSVNDLKKGRKTATIAVFFGGMIIALASLIMNVTLGIDAHQSSNFPLLSAARMVSIGKFLERIDPIVVFIMTLGVIIKSAVFIFCSLKGLEYVFRFPYRNFTLPISLLAALFSTLIADNFGDHLRKSSYFLIIYFHLVMQLFIPGIAIIFLIRKIRKQKNTRGKQM